MTRVDDVLNELKAKARPDHLEGMARYGIVVERRLGVSVPNMWKIAKQLGKNHKLAIELWKTGIPEAKIVTVMIDESEKVTEKHRKKKSKCVTYKTTSRI